MDSEDLYDEFGNFLGDANDSDAESDIGASAGSMSTEGHDLEALKTTQKAENYMDLPMVDPQTHEETGMVLKTPTSPRFPAVEMVYVDPTAEGNEEPVIMPIKEKKLGIEYTNTDYSKLPPTKYEKTYLHTLPALVPERVRNVAIVGGLHTGKTSLVDAFIAETHPGIGNNENNGTTGATNGPKRYLDTHVLEQKRGVSIHTSAAALLVEDPRGRSHAVNFVDSPGHPDFRDDVLALLGVAEGVVFVVDVVEGLTGAARALVGEAVRRNLPLVIVLNKIDRLVLELRLPPRDAAQKLVHVLAEVSACIHHSEYVSTYTHTRVLSPLHGNVVFAAPELHISFTLATWARLYAQVNVLPIPEDQFERFLWGDVYYNNGSFLRNPATPTLPTAFEQFVLDPLYKLISHTLVASADDRSLSILLWDQFRVTLPRSTYKQDPQTLLREVCHAVFPTSADFIDLIISSVGAPDGDAVLRARGTDLNSISESDAVVEVFKVCPSSVPASASGSGSAIGSGFDSGSDPAFECLAKIHHGTLNVGDTVRVVDNSYTGNSHGGDSLRTEKITGICLPVGRYNIAVERAVAGTIVLLRTAGNSVGSSASLFSLSVPVSLLTSIHTTTHGQRSFYKVAVECEHPAELPRLVAALRHLSQSYLSIVTRLEESGEHVVLAPGELYLDCFLHDLRTANDKYLSLKISDPMVKFAETCGERSATKIPIYTPSNAHYASITAEPVGDKRLLRAIENGHVSISLPAKTTAKVLRDDFGWDALAARSVWCFGPQDMQNPSMLLDDTIEGETDKTALREAKDLLVAGFKLGVNEGPLCDEPVRRTKFKILDAVLGTNALTSGGQIIPMTRNAVHCGVLTAAPRLLEPMYRVHVTCTYKCVLAVHTMLEKRRGWAVAERAIVATPLYEIEGCVPIIDSVGLDTDMRLNTQGQAFCSLEFFRWDVVPGDPLDKLCALPQMKPVPRASLARDFVLKTRKRKGLSGEPTLQKYIDPDLYARLKQNGIVN